MCIRDRYTDVPIMPDANKSDIKVVVVATIIFFFFLCASNSFLFLRVCFTLLFHFLNILLIFKIEFSSRFRLILPIFPILLFSIKLLLIIG